MYSCFDRAGLGLGSRQHLHTSYSTHSITMNARSVRDVTLMLAKLASAICYWTSKYAQLKRVVGLTYSYSEPDDLHFVNIFRPCLIAYIHTCIHVCMYKLEFLMIALNFIIQQPVFCFVNLTCLHYETLKNLNRISNTPWHWNIPPLKYCRSSRKLKRIKRQSKMMIGQVTKTQKKCIRL